jgi:phosphoenolpyruvate carboxykinase (GTP)
LYRDLVPLFEREVGKLYSHDDYVAQFSLRVPENLAKIERILKVYREQVLETPAELYEILEQQRQRLLEAQRAYGDFISPEVYTSD